MSLGIARHARAPLASLGPRMIVVRDRCIYVLCVRETALLKAEKKGEKRKKMRAFFINQKKTQ